MPEPIWKPSRERIERANVTRLMRKLGYAVDPSDAGAVTAAARAFVQRSAEDIEWFWSAALDDMGVRWQRPYERLLDTSRGNAWADWFIGGQANIADNCV